MATTNRAAENDYSLVLSAQLIGSIQQIGSRQRDGVTGGGGVGGGERRALWRIGGLCPSASRFISFEQILELHPCLCALVSSQGSTTAPTTVRERRRGLVDWKEELLKLGKPQRTTRNNGGRESPTGISSLLTWCVFPFSLVRPLHAHRPDTDPGRRQLYQ